MTLLEDIDKSKHIVIEVEEEFLAPASALYTHILRLHKKASLVCKSEDIEYRLSFLPWMDKIKKTGYSSADLKISLDINSSKLYEIFKEADIKLNVKMATALYAGLLQETKGFTNSSLNGTKFAIAKELIEYGAEYKSCTKFILKSNTLSFLRLKAILLQKMRLEENATVAIVPLDDNDLKATGAKVEDSYLVLEEVLSLVHVRKVLLVKSDEKDKILKSIEKEI